LPYLSNYPGIGKTTDRSFRYTQRLTKVYPNLSNTAHLQANTPNLAHGVCGEYPAVNHFSYIANAMGRSLCSRRGRGADRLLLLPVVLGYDGVFYEAVFVKVLW
jgi:hypothetical protein